MKRGNGDFGVLLKKLRLKTGFGLRKFAGLLEMPASNLSAIEHGRRRMPDDKLFLAVDLLGLEKGSDEWNQLFDLSKEAGELPADVQNIAQKGFIPALLRTIDNNQLSDDEIAKLIKEIQGTDVSSSTKSC